MKGSWLDTAVCWEWMRFGGCPWQKRDVGSEIRRLFVYHPARIIPSGFAKPTGTTTGRTPDGAFYGRIGMGAKNRPGGSRGQA